MNIGIDTQQIDQPIEQKEFTDAEIDRMNEIESKVNSLLDEFEKIYGCRPQILGCGW